MKLFSLLSIIAILATPLASARIGDSGKKCIERYGKPETVDKEDEVVIFKKNGFFIVTYFKKGKCIAIAYQKEGDLDEITKNEIKVLIAANKGKGYWVRDNEAPKGLERWTNKKEGLTADYSISGCSLSIDSDASMDDFLENEKKKEAASEKKEADNLSDF